MLRLLPRVVLCISQVLKRLQAKIIIPTTVAISELAATENPERRLSLLRLVKSVGQDNRPFATPNQLMILACQGYSRRDSKLTLNAGTDAEGAWISLHKPELIDAAAQRMAWEFNQEREGVFRVWHEGLRSTLQADFDNGVPRPRSVGALIHHYSRNDDFLYQAVNPLYERAVGQCLPRKELWDLLNSLPHWRPFLAAHTCAIYQRAVRGSMGMVTRTIQERWIFGPRHICHRAMRSLREISASAVPLKY